MLVMDPLKRKNLSYTLSHAWLTENESGADDTSKLSDEDSNSSIAGGMQDIDSPGSPRDQLKELPGTNTEQQQNERSCLVS